MGRKGQPSPNRGKTYEEIYGLEKATELKERRSKALRGRIFSDETRNKLSKAKKGKYIGENNSFYGKKHTDEAKEKIRQTKLGKPSWNSGKTNVYSKETLKRMRDHAANRIGKRNPNWKGGICESGQMIRLSDKMKKWRLDIFKQDNYTCQRCLERGGKLHAHHIIPFAIAQEERLRLDNGATLCGECHRYIHFNGELAST